MRPASAARAAAGVSRWAAALRREATRLRNRYALPRARILYHPAYRVADDALVDGRRGERILGYLVAQRWIDHESVLRPPRLRISDLLRVHGADYLSKLDDPAELDRIFGGRTSTGADGAHALEAQRWATAGTVFATTVALKYPWIRSPVVNLGGGFHHARRDRGTGFCAFNDVAIAIDRARAEGFSGRVLVIDLDAHQGDGTRAMFADDDRVYTFSMHGEPWDQSPAVASEDVALGPAVGDETYLRALGDHLPHAFARAEPDLVFYVAGVDVAKTDPIGGFRLSAEAIAARDRAVLEAARPRPTVVVLAGGYGREAWRYTARTLVWLLSGQDRAIPSSDERALAAFRRIRSSLAGKALSSDSSRRAQQDGGAWFTIDEGDLYADLVLKQNPRYLGFYSLYGLELAFERYGLSAHLNDRGYTDFDVVPELARPGGGQGIRVYADKTHAEVLLELVTDETVLEGGLRLLSIEWLLLQDPRRAPTPREPLLPGQKHPGLGCLRIVVGMLVMACERLGYDGISLVPSQYHVAAQARRLFTFFDPSDEAFFLALERATRGLPLHEASTAIAAGRIRDARTSEVVSWRPRRMVLPVNQALKERLSSPAYAKAVEDEARKLAFTLPS
jgi:acetoin utilization deacetylase AcuC-like enzyme